MNRLAGPGINLDQLKAIDLAGFVFSHYGFRVSSGGAALCPFHEDKKPSLSVFQRNGNWGWKCHGCDCGGTILDFVMKKEGICLSDAARRVMEIEGVRQELRTSIKENFDIVRVHSYTDGNGQETWQKVKLSDGTFRCRRKKGGRWVYNLKGIARLPYRYDKIKDERGIVITEGERDADTLAAICVPATSGPSGKDSWPEEFTPLFSDKEVRIIYDVGQDEAALVVARKLSAVTPYVFILKVPLPNREDDITDYLGQFPNNDAKRDAFLEILAKEEPFDPPPAAAPAAFGKKAFLGSLQGFFIAEIPENEPLIENLLGREEFLYVGGVKHSHKTSLLMSLGLFFASGKSPWLTFPVPKPGRFLMVQQELGEHEFRKRLRAAILYGGFDPSVLDRFFPFTGTGDPIKIMTEEGFSRLEDLVKKFYPLDILALDPQASFCTGKENDDMAQAVLRDRLNLLKTKYRIGIVMSHHFSSKRPAGSLDAPTELGGWFRGHTCLSDAADAQVGLHRLPGQRTNPNLPRAYENYNQVEVTLRNGKWPPRFAVEFDERSFLMGLSNVWQEAGFRIPVGNVREVCDAHGGSILLADLIVYYVAQIGEISAPTVKNAVNREVAAGLIETERAKGKGSPILIRSKGNKP